MGKTNYLNNQYFGYLNDFINHMRDGTIPPMTYISLDGGRKSSKTTSAVQFACLTMLLFPKDCDVYAWRGLKGEDADELFEEFVMNMELLLGRPLSHKSKEINFGRRRIRLNGNTLRVSGVNSANKRKRVKVVGVKRARNKKFLINIKEERYEFSDDEVIAIDHALGGYQHIIKIDITNPHSTAYPYIKSLEKEMIHREDILKSKGQQFKFIKDKDYGRIIHYTNGRANPFLSKADIQTILDTGPISKVKARVADYGMPGVEENAIYAEVYEKIKVMAREQLPAVMEYSVGVDLAESSQADGGATVLVLKGRGYSNERIYLNHYYHHNKDFYLSPREKVKAMIDFLIQENQALKGALAEQGLMVGTEWDYAYIEMFEEEAIIRGVSDWLEFDKAIKTRTLERVNVRLYYIAKGMYYVNEKCEEHLNELQIQVGDDHRKDAKTKRRMPKDADDHTTDADDYADADWAVDVFEQEQYKFLYDKY